MNIIALKEVAQIMISPKKRTRRDKKKLQSKTEAEGDVTTLQQVEFYLYVEKKVVLEKVEIDIPADPSEN